MCVSQEEGFLWLFLKHRERPFSLTLTVCMCVCACARVRERECVCAQVSAVSTLRCRCKMLPPWRDPGCCTAFCLPLKQFFLLLFLSCQGHQDQQRRWIPLCPLGVLCQHHQHCYTPTPLLVSARQSLCALQPSPKSERCSSGALRHTPEIFSPFLSVCLSHSYAPSPCSAQVKALAVWR